jgi:hypothetical protein
MRTAARVGDAVGRAAQHRQLAVDPGVQAHGVAVLDGVAVLEVGGPDLVGVMVEHAFAADEGGLAAQPPAGQGLLAGLAVVVELIFARLREAVRHGLSSEMADWKASPPMA